MAVPNGLPTIGWFELGFRGRYDLRTPAVSVDDGGSVVAISSVVSNLLPGTTYQTRLVASNAAGITYGPPALFASAASALAWGDNWFAQSALPSGLDDAVAIAAGGHHTLILRADGKVAAFGYNGHGQAMVSRGLSDVIAVAAGESHSVALRTDGKVVAWGANNSGQSAVPAGLGEVIAIAAGDNHTLALRLDGTIVAWGLNGSGQTDVPPGLSNVVAVAAGTAHSVALRADGFVFSWGDNSFGQTRGPTNSAEIVAIAAGANHTLALRKNGTLLAWGLNSSGQVNVPAGLNHVIAVAAGSYHSLALRSDGSVVGWGLNGSGETSMPYGLADTTAIAGGGATTILLANNVSPQTRSAVASATINRDSLMAISSPHAGSDPLTILSGAFSHRLALYPDRKPSRPVPQQLIAPANEDLVITLTAATARTSSPALRITSLPPVAKLYQYAFGTRGPELTSNSVVTDPGHRVIFAPAVNAFGVPLSAFNFVATDGSASSSPATITLNVLPPEQPRILAEQPLPDGAFQLLFAGHSNTTWAVSGSTNLWDWQLLGLPTQLSPGLFEYTDPDAPQFPTRFYRVTLAPLR
jgi:hypothetical protein